MTLIHISFGLMTVAAVVLYIANRRLIKMLKSASHALESTGESLEAARKELSSAYMRIEAKNMHIDSLNRERTNRILSGLNKAEAVEDPEEHCFIVLRKRQNRLYRIACYHYDPNDPDDREYIRIHAEEVADKLNEKP